MFVHSRASQPLPRLGDYELVRRIATGGMAEVYEARREGPRGFNKRVALKRILPQLAMDDRLVRMFCAEARVHAALAHPNLVSVLDFGEADGELFLVMEYVDGVALSDVLRAVNARRRAVELGPALHIAREVAAGLSHAHEYRDESDAPLGVVHRDVAPNNILLGRLGEVKLTDFGIVHSAWSDVRTAPGELRGKIGYVSPEQAQGRGVAAQSDLFSLGVVLAEMLLGAPLIAGTTELELLQNLQRRSWAGLDTLRKKLSPDVLQLLEQLLAASPRERPLSAALTVSRLDALASAHGVRCSAHELAAWLADLGVVRLESAVRVSVPQRPPPLPARAEQATLVDDQPPESPRAPPKASVATRAANEKPAPSAASTLRYRLRRPGGEVVGPLSLGSVLSLLATARAGLDSELGRGDGPFLKLSSAFELTRLAARPLYRFFEPVALLASERHPVERGSLAAQLLGLSLSRRTGLLVHRVGTEQHRVYWEDGAPTVSASTDPSELLGNQLVRAGLVTQTDLERVLESGYRSGCGVGESLVRAGLISEDELRRSIGEQRIRRLGAVCRASGGELFFVDGAQAGEKVLSVSQKPLAPLVEALRAGYAEAELLQLLSGLSHTAVSPAPACAVLRAALCLAPDETYAFELCARGVKLGLVLREARARGQGALRAAAFAIFVGLSAGAFVPRAE